MKHVITTLAIALASVVSPIQASQSPVQTYNEMDSSGNEINHLESELDMDVVEGMEQSESNASVSNAFTDKIKELMNGLHTSMAEAKDMGFAIDEVRIVGGLTLPHAEVYFSDMGRTGREENVLDRNRGNKILFTALSLMNDTRNVNVANYQLKRIKVNFTAPPTVRLITKLNPANQSSAQGTSSKSDLVQKIESVMNALKTSLNEIKAIGFVPDEIHIVGGSGAPHAEVFFTDKGATGKEQTVIARNKSHKILYKSLKLLNNSRSFRVANYRLNRIQIVFVTLPKMGLWLKYDRSVTAGGTGTSKDSTIEKCEDALNDLRYSISEIGGIGFAASDVLIMTGLMLPHAEVFFSDLGRTGRESEIISRNTTKPVLYASLKLLDAARDVQVVHYRLQKVKVDFTVPPKIHFITKLDYR